MLDLLGIGWVLSLQLIRIFTELRILNACNKNAVLP
jgi:hypothetical protein